MTILHQSSLNAGEVSRALYARIDYTKYQYALKTCLNFFVHLHGGVSTRPGTNVVATVYDSTIKSRVLPFQFNTEQSYIVELSDQLVSFYKDGAQILTTLTITGITQANPAVVSYTGNQPFNTDDVDIAGVVGMTEVNGNTYTIANVTGSTFELSGVDSTAFTAYSSGGTADAPYRITSPYVEANLFKLRYTQDADTMTITSDLYAAYELTRTAHDNWTLTAVTYGATLSAPTGLVPTPTTAGGITYTYKVTALTAIGEESLPSAAASAASVQLTETNPMNLAWTADPSAVRYLVYRYKGGSYGYIGSADTNAFVDDNIQPDTLDAPPETINPFASSNHPKASVYHQQRLVYGGLVNHPTEIDPSRVGAPKNFNTSFPVKDNDGFSIDINSRYVNAVEHLTSGDDLLAFTSGAVWSLSSGDLAFTTANIKAVKRNNNGCSDVAPLEASDSIAFVTRNGKGVQELLHTTSGERPVYANRDLTALAEHLFRDGSIVDWTYAQLPFSIIWVVMDDGRLHGLTYIRDQEVYAWHRHTTDGLFESIATIEEAGSSAVYCTVKRTIDGVDTRFVERFAAREFVDITNVVATDCSVTYSGAATDTMTGLDHLDGETVTGLADGNVIPDTVVANGQITLEFEAGCRIRVSLKASGRH